MEEKLYTQQEVDEIIKQKETEIKEKALIWVEEKSQEKAEIRAQALALQFRELTPEEQQFERDKKQIEFYVTEWALPEGMNLWKMMINRQLGRELWLSFMQTINGVAFINWKPSVYGETFLSLIVKNWYKIKVLEETEEKVEVELEWPNGTQKWSFTKKEAEKLWVLSKWVWAKYPIRMMRYKAIRNAQNVLCPEILGWAYLAEEAREIEEVQVEEKEEIKAEEKFNSLQEKYGNI